MKRWATVAVLFAALLVLAGCATFLVNVTGMPVDKATSALKGVGLKVGAITYSEGSTAAAGIVIAQVPGAGQAAAIGASVALTVAGAAPVTVPDVSGLDKAKAQTALSAAGFAMGAMSQAYDSSSTAGTVESQTPAAGAAAPKGSVVDLVLSSGPAPVPVPQVKGKTQADAVAALEAAGYTVTVKQKDDTSKKGTVLSQKPSSADAQPGTAVVIYVSSGAPVPVLGQPFEFSVGFGSARPRTVSWGGDPTSWANEIVWSSWGGAKAIGTCMAVCDYYSATVADAPTVSATIVAFDLGTYRGHYMYRKVVWFFPQYGDKFDPKAAFDWSW